MVCTDAGVCVTELNTFGTKPVLTNAEMEQEYHAIYAKAKPEKEAANKRSNLVRTLMREALELVALDIIAGRSEIAPSKLGAVPDLTVHLIGFGETRYPVHI